MNGPQGVGCYVLVSMNGPPGRVSCWCWGEWSSRGCHVELELIISEFKKI